MVVAMQTGSQTLDPVPDELLHPSYWLVYGLEWHGDSSAAEAAMAFAPSVIPRDMLNYGAVQVLGCADLYAGKHNLAVVFFSDLTRMFAEAGRSWSQLGVEWQQALKELVCGQYPALLLTISERAHLVICGSDSGSPSAVGSEEREEHDRALLRQAVARRLAEDWPPYMQAVARAGKIQVL